jgi:hypothetical protein
VAYFRRYFDRLSFPVRSFTVRASVSSTSLAFGLFDDRFEAFQGFFEPGRNFRRYFGHDGCG